MTDGRAMMVSERDMMVWRVMMVSERDMMVWRVMMVSESDMMLWRIIRWFRSVSCVRSRGWRSQNYHFCDGLASEALLVQAHIPSRRKRGCA